MADDRPFVVFSDDWGRWPSSSQHLFRLIGASRRVLWVETTGMRPPRLSLNHAQRVLEKVRSWSSARSDPWTVMPAQMERLAVPMQPWFGRRALASFNDSLLARAVRRRLDQLGWRDPIVVVTVPIAVGAVERLRPSAVLWYRVDDFSLWPGYAHEVIAEREERLKRLATGLLFSAPPLDVLSFSGPRELLEHGVDAEHFETARGRAPAFPERPVFLFAGLVDERLDQRLLRALPGHVTLVGRASVPIEPGAVVLPPAHWSDLPATLRSADVLLLPYRRGAQTDTIQPLKLREYLASGVPIASTGLPEVARLGGDLVEIGDGPGGFAEAVERALADDPTGPERRRAAVREHRWELRAEQLLGFVSRLGP